MHKFIFSSLFAVILGIISWSAYLSAPSDAAPMLAPAREWAAKLSGGRIEDSSPTLFDLDGDSKQEIIIGTTNNGSDAALTVLEGHRHDQMV